MKNKVLIIKGAISGICCIIFGVGAITFSWINYTLFISISIISMIIMGFLFSALRTQDIFFSWLISIPFMIAAFFILMVSPIRLIHRTWIIVYPESTMTVGGGFAMGVNMVLYIIITSFSLVFAFIVMKIRKSVCK